MLMLTKIEIHSLIPSQTSFCHIAAVKPSKRCRYKDVIAMQMIALPVASFTGNEQVKSSLPNATTMVSL